MNKIIEIIIVVIVLLLAFIISFKHIQRKFGTKGLIIGLFSLCGIIGLLLFGQFIGHDNGFIPQILGLIVFAFSILYIIKTVIDSLAKQKENNKIEESIPRLKQSENGPLKLKISDLQFKTMYEFLVKNRILVDPISENEFKTKFLLEPLTLNLDVPSFREFYEICKTLNRITIKKFCTKFLNHNTQEFYPAGQVYNFNNYSSKLSKKFDDFKEKLM